MKWADIKAFIPDGNYQCNVGLGRITAAIQDYEAAYALQLNPDFQRGHVWSEEQQINFVEYFLRQGRMNPIYFNKPSWMGPSIEEYDEMVCVDGLQRLTALMRFEANEIPAFGSYFEDFEGNLGMRFTIVFNVNSLKSRKEVLQWYVDLNDGGTPHTSEEIERVRNLITQEQ